MKFKELREMFGFPLHFAKAVHSISAASMLLYIRNGQYVCPLNVVVYQLKSVFMIGYAG